LYTPHARTAKPRPSVDKGSQRKSKKNSGSSNAKQQAKKKAQAKLSTISVDDSSSSSEEDSEPPPKVHKQIEKKVGKGKRGTVNSQAHSHPACSMNSNNQRSA
jgi:hypothetical protein